MNNIHNMTINGFGSTNNVGEISCKNAVLSVSEGLFCICS